MVKVSRSLKQIAIKAKTTSELLSKKLGREPSNEEIAVEINVEKEIWLWLWNLIFQLNIYMG